MFDLTEAGSVDAKDGVVPTELPPPASGAAATSGHRETFPNY